MSNPIFLPKDQENPEIMVKGRARERRKAERRSLSFSRYYEALKEGKKAEELKPEEKKKRARKLKTQFPVVNIDNPIIEGRE